MSLYFHSIFSQASLFGVHRHIAAPMGFATFHASTCEVKSPNIKPLHDIMVRYADSGEPIMKKVFEWADENERGHDPVFKQIRRDGDKVESIEDPDRSQLFLTGNNDDRVRVGPYSKRAEVQKFLRKMIQATLKKSNLSSFAELMMWRHGKGAGNADGHQQWHRDLLESMIKQIGEVYMIVPTRATKIVKVKSQQCTHNFHVLSTNVLFEFAGCEGIVGKIR